MRLLLVEDNDKFRRILASIITRLDDVEVIGQAGDVSDAVGEIKRTKPDAVILDIHLPGGSGFDVLQAAKSAKPAPVVLMLTVCSGKEYREKCMSLGADYFFEKSDDLTKMMSTLTKLARQFRTHEPEERRHEGIRKITKTH